MSLARRLLGLQARWRRNEAGTAVLEVTLLAPAILIFILFIVGLGRIANTRQEVASVAASAARAASLQPYSAQAANAAQEAAVAALGTSGVSCHNLIVTTDTSNFRPGGRLVTTVSCTTELSDVIVTGLPGSKTFSETAIVPIENFRSTP